MANNTTLNAGAGGDTIRDLDRAGVKTPIVALDLNPAGAETLMAGAMPVTGTFWQATQPVSGTVTANAGTNLNTSALALEAGGHLAAIDGKVPALGQALAAASVPVVLTAAQLATLTPLSTIAALTAITNPLPAGTNLLGQIAAGQQIASVFNGTAAIVPQYASLTTSSSGAQTLVAAVASKRIYVLRWRVTVNGATNVNLQSHTTTTLSTAVNYLPQYGSGGGAYCPAGIMATAAGEALDVNNSAAVSISIDVTYVAF